MQRLPGQISIIGVLFVFVCYQEKSSIKYFINIEDSLCKAKGERKI